jgi:hypothetical protein
VGYFDSGHVYLVVSKKAGMSEVKFYAMVDQAAMVLNLIEFKDVSCTNEKL